MTETKRPFQSLFSDRLTAHFPNCTTGYATTGIGLYSPADLPTASRLTYCQPYLLPAGLPPTASLTYCQRAYLLPALPTASGLTYLLSAGLPVANGSAAPVVRTATRTDGSEKQVSLQHIFRLSGVSDLGNSAPLSRMPAMLDSGVDGRVWPTLSGLLSLGLLPNFAPLRAIGMAGGLRPLFFLLGACFPGSVSPCVGV